MKVVKTNQDLIVGRKYLCRTRPIKLQNGSYSKPEIEIYRVGEEQGRRYVGPHRFWAYDKHDAIISWAGEQRLNAEAKAMNLPVSEMIVIDSDYEVNSQAMERWDMIGPIPEVKEGLLHLLFDHPEILPFLEGTVSINHDGAVNVFMKSIETDTEGFMPAVIKEKVFTISDEVSLNDFIISNHLVPVEDVDESGFVTTESCGSKIGKQIRLTEKKHNQFGYYNEGAVLTIHQLVDPTGYIAGVVNPNNPYNRQNLVNVGFDGFEFVD